ncbi:Vms1/Ankzf1 family peptidyl-tRNA hydrolase [Haloarchaeobius sp. HME9146]|uniref:Vms1/Ankzf1 family peptidyl-tRNA hydrolase n=1 Tax=Haloarchaeobius sp. HME9146 TaxID=2978732 RepID=UPI0021BE25D7|nr:Vms1/Ankzf1 family peptidyl-tRNA hydrolase [Haloarchaeobius sp. HME9146]MCT9097741.1 Vms1/Ankzf1 family peptidyl-tRNA hydrolase [Haloarchaeobius sp. HME9146]
MLDELLGRAELKTRIEELEADKQRLQNQLEAEQERRADAATARQDAEERVNRLEDRIAQLEGELDRVDTDETDLAFRGQEDLHGERLSEVLDRLASVETGPEGALSAMVTDEVPEAAAETLGQRATLLDRAAPCLYYTDDAGLVQVALDAPLAPEEFCEWGESFRLDRAWVEPVGRFSLALVRADLFALGTYEGTERVAVSGFESDVKGKHSKGGFSQARFERIRDEQIDSHLDDCREAIADRDADRLVVVGDRRLVREFADEAVATAAVDATGDPRAALDDAFHEFFSTRLRLL